MAPAGLQQRLTSLEECDTNGMSHATAESIARQPLNPGETASSPFPVHETKAKTCQHNVKAHTAHSRKTQTIWWQKQWYTKELHCQQLANRGPEAVRCSTSTPHDDVSRHKQQWYTNMLPHQCVCHTHCKASSL